MTRSRARRPVSSISRILGGLAAIGGLACNPLATDERPATLSPVYALKTIDFVPLPVVVSVPGSEDRRIIADTLRFTTPGFYGETTISQSTTGTAPPVERFDRNSSPYVALSNNSLELPVFAGGSGTAAYSSSTLTVYAAGGRIWGYTVVP